MADAKEYARRLVRGSSTIFTALIVAGVLGLVLRMFLTRSLSLSDYGMFYLVFTWISFLALFRDMGLNSALTKFIPEFLSNKRFDRVKSLILFVTSLQVLVALPVSLSLFFFSDQIAVAIAGTTGASLIVKALGIWFFIMTFFHVFRSSFQGFQDQAPYAAMEVLYICFTFFMVVVCVHMLRLGATGAALGYLIASPVLVAVWLGLMCRRHGAVLKGGLQINGAFVKKVLEFSLMVFVGSIGGVILSYMDTIMIGAFHTTADVGLYQAAQPITLLISYFSAALGIVLMPMTSEIWARKENELLSRAVHLILKFSMMIIVPIVFVLMTFPDVVLRSVFGPEYVLATITLQILTAAVVLSTLFSILQSVAAGIGKPVLTTITILAMACLNLIGNFLLIPPYGIVGAAVTTFISWFFGLILILCLLRNSIKFAVPGRSILKTIIAGAVAMLVITVLKSVVILEPWWAKAPVVILPSLVVYVGVILVTKSVSKEELNVLSYAVPIPKRLLMFMEKILRD